MALKELIENQTIKIDDHKRGNREIKNWDNARSDIHIDKTTNFPLNGKRQKVRIKIPINSDRPISIENERHQEVYEIPNRLKREIQQALENKQTRESFVKDVLKVLEDFETALSTEERAEEVLTRISKHFELYWPKNRIKQYVNNILEFYSLVYENDDGKKYFAKVDKEKIEIGRYNGYAKQFKKIGR
ncbi:MAG: hypothetical protein KHZ60_10935 [Alistipes sp.]|nr:hypothetical protein [Alistipes sp.]MBS5020564.1 hypothetical protein [Alistipes sp.]